MQLDSNYCLILSKSLPFLRFSLFLQMQNSTCLIGLLCSFKLSVCLQCGRPWVLFLGREDPLEKEMAPHFSTLAWKIPWMEEPRRLRSMGSLGVGHD